MISVITSKWTDDTMRAAACAAVLLAGQPEKTIDATLNEDDGSPRVREIARRVAKALPSPNLEDAPDDELHADARAVHDVAFDAYVVDRSALTNLIVKPLADTRELSQCRERIIEIYDLVLHMKDSRAIAEAQRRIVVAHRVCNLIESQLSDEHVIRYARYMEWTMYRKISFAILIIALIVQHAY